MVVAKKHFVGRFLGVGGEGCSVALRELLDPPVDSAMAHAGVAPGACPFDAAPLAGSGLCRPTTLLRRSVCIGIDIGPR